MELEAQPNPLILSNKVMSFQVNFQSSLDKALPLDNNLVWFHFKNGNYILFDLLTKSVIKFGQTSKQIFKAISLSPPYILIYDQENELLKILDYTSSEPYLSNAEFLVPTQFAVKGDLRYDKLHLNLIINKTKLYYFSQSSTILISEIDPVDHQDYFIIYLTTLAQNNLVCKKQAKIQISPQNYTIQRLDNTSKVIIRREFLKNQQLKFRIYDILNQIQEGQDQCESYESEEKLTIVIRHSCYWIQQCNNFQLEPQIAFFGNICQEEYPVIIVYNLVQRKIVMNQTLKIYENPWMISKVLKVDLQNQLLIFHKFDTTQSIGIFNMRNQMLQQNYQLQSNIYTLKFSKNKSYLIEYQQEYDYEDNNYYQNELVQQQIQKQKTISFNMKKIIKIKTYLLNILIKKQILSKYGENICKSIMDMIYPNQWVKNKNSILFFQNLSIEDEGLANKK